MKTAINIPSKLIKREYNSTIVSVLATVITIGIMLIASYEILDFEESQLMSSLITFSSVALICTSIALSLSLKRTVLTTNGAQLYSKIVEFKETEYHQIQGLIEENRWCEITDIPNGDEGIAMRLEVVYTKDRCFAAYQFFKYVPHSYEPCSAIVYLDGESPNVPTFKRSR